MMLFTQVTRCPHCHTSFRVSDEHLEAAGGVVRCGSCLQVFKATEHLVSETEPAKTVVANEIENNNVEADSKAPAMRFMPDVDDQPKSASKSPLAFTFADEPDVDLAGEDDGVDGIDNHGHANDLTDDASNVSAHQPEPEPTESDGVEPEQPTSERSTFEPSTSESLESTDPTTSKLNESPEFDQFSTEKKAQHKAALANHLVDLSADDDDEPDLDLDGDLLFSDDGVIPAEDRLPDEPVIELTDPVDESIQINADIESEPDFNDTSEDHASEYNLENANDVQQDAEPLDYLSPNFSQAEEQTEQHIHHALNHDAPNQSDDLDVDSEVDITLDNIALPDAEPTDDSIQDLDNIDPVSTTEPQVDSYSVSSSVTDSADAPLSEVAQSTAIPDSDSLELLDALTLNKDEQEDDFSFTLTDSGSPQANITEHDVDAAAPPPDDDFAGLLNDAMADLEADDNDSLDDLLAKAETDNTVQASSAIEDKAPNDIAIHDQSNANNIEEDDLRFHDDMEDVDKLAELLGEEAPKDPEQDPLTANLSNIVSDDYNDIMSNIENEAHDDSAYEDKWALELLGASDRPKQTRYHDDIEGPDLNSIEEFENSGSISFSDIHEQNRTSSIRNEDLEVGADLDVSADAADTDTDNSPQKPNHTSLNDAQNNYAQSNYVDEYMDDYVDDYIDDDINDIPSESPFADEEVNYNERLPGESAIDEYANAFDASPEGKAIAENIGLSREVEIGIPNMTIEPISLEEDKPQSTGWTWSLIALLFIVAAMAQVAYFRFDSAARSETWRPMYEQICAVTGCTLPGIQNVQLIRASNTVFNQHRTDPTGIVVDTLLTNTADYPQPYPDIELEFRDLNGQIVAQRTFAPSDYLAGDVLPGDSMPSDIPVHIALEVVNPGPEAVSRQIFIRQNQ
jgi:predicted Zn finger-like uncharacterized protein